MLAVEVQMESVRRHETSFSLRKLQDLLNLTPESMEDKKPCADLHMEGENEHLRNKMYNKHYFYGPASEG